MKYFKSSEPVDPSGVVAWSPYIEPDQVIEAYENGIFPWPDQERSIYWFSPYQRGILEFQDLKWSKSDLSFFTKCNYEFKFNTNFELTIETCAEVKKNPVQKLSIELKNNNANDIQSKNKIEAGTWITEDLIETYVELNKKGIAISYEVYDQDCLIGGMYGVKSKNYFSAESMFYKKPNASKFALFKAIEHLKQFKVSWIDTQVVTDFTSRLGAKEIPRIEFLKRIL